MDNDSRRADADASSAYDKKPAGKRHILQAAAFLAVFLILFHLLSGVLIRKTNGEYDLIRSFYRVEKRTLDVLCLGSSHAYHSFQPNDLWHEYGIASCVMGTPQQTIAGTYFLLKEAFRYQDPQVVVVETYYFKSQKPFVNEARMRCVADGMRPGPVKREMLKELLPELTWKDSLSWHIPFIAYHGRWAELNNADFHQYHWSKGAILVSRIDPDVTDPGLSEVEPVPISDYTMGYLRRILELCNEHGARLVLFASPYGTGNGMDYKHFLRNQAKQMGYESAAQELGVPYLYFQRDNAAGVDYGSDFCDATHLNSPGAEKVTLALGQFLKENYPLPDHRGESRYESWNEDYEEYLVHRLADTGDAAEIEDPDEDMTEDI